MLVAMLLTMYGGGAFADGGVPELLKFAEQYHNQQGDKSLGSPKNTSIRNDRSARPPLKRIDDPALNRSLKAQDARLAKQQATIRALEKQLAALRESKVQPSGKTASLPGKKDNNALELTQTDFTPLTQLISSLGQAIKGLPDVQLASELVQAARDEVKAEQAELARSQTQVRALKQQISEIQKHLQSDGDEKTLAKQSHRELEVHIAGLQSQLTEKNQLQKDLQHHLETEVTQRKSLENRLAALQSAQQEQLVLAEKALSEQVAVQVSTSDKLQARIGELEGENKRLQETYEQAGSRNNTLKAEMEASTKAREDLQRQVGEADTRLATQDRELLQLKGDVQHLRDRAKLLANVDSLKAAPGRQAYAAGTALGLDIIEMLEEHKSWGLNTDRKTILAGIVDAFAGQYQLTTEVLARALADSESQINQARGKISAVQQKKGEAFIATFKKKKGAVQSPSGFWYQIEYAGDEPVAPDAIVDVVVKEMLTDGTVIQDMDTAGNVLSQPLNDYPLLFREAIGHLRNHGTMTIVVPPDLAYGETGFPPKVPPNSTMVYELRMVDSKPR
ncbi:FKBP-type peptidyl-prolyl cis-trans isomerase N-terminal domain-containing protein [Serratia liquefaciens]